VEDWAEISVGCIGRRAWLSGRSLSAAWEWSEHGQGRRWSRTGRRHYERAPQVSVRGCVRAAGSGRCCGRRADDAPEIARRVAGALHESVEPKFSLGSSEYVGIDRSTGRSTSMGQIRSAICGSPSCQYRRGRGSAGVAGAVMTLGFTVTDATMIPRGRLATFCGDVVADPAGSGG